jgi:hypothetical protein
VKKTHFFSILLQLFEFHHHFLAGFAMPKFFVKAIQPGSGSVSAIVREKGK